MHPFDEELVALERAQHGLVARDQLDAGWKRGLVRRRLHDRRTRIGTRVFANPAVPTSADQRIHAAVLDAGPGARASHETAAHLFELPLPGPAALEILTSATRRPIVAGARMHRMAQPDARDLAIVRGIPATSVALTIYSLSGRFSIERLGRMCDDAVRRKLLLLDDLVEVVERLAPANGRSRQKTQLVLARRLPGVEEREAHLEDFVVAATDRFRLPPPKAQHAVEYGGQTRRIDLCYVDALLALEAKGFRWYRERATFDRDALRGNELLHLGYRVLTFTSAFTDLQIARDIAHELGLPSPAAKRPLTFGEWMRAR